MLFFLTLFTSVDFSPGPPLIDESFRRAGIGQDDWRMSFCAKMLISASPDASVLRGLWPGPKHRPYPDCPFAINMKRAPAKEYKESQGCVGE